MKTLDFDTSVLPADQRLPAFRLGAVDFKVEAVGDPLDFTARWRLLKLGDLNAIHSTVTPVHYLRNRAMIEADGEDRVTIHYFLEGGAVGELDGRSVQVGAGGAAVWDLTRTIDMQSHDLPELLIVTLPRYMLDEVFAVVSYDCVLPPSAELALAADRLRSMLDRAEEITEGVAVYFGRALRDLFAMAMVPAVKHASNTDVTTGPLLRRICHLLDASLNGDVGEAELAERLDVSLDHLSRTLQQFGGLSELVERRRLLAAYRFLRDPDDGAPVSAIAWRCGFTNLSLFSRRFRDVFQVSPSDLRRLHTANLPEWAGAYHVEKNYGAFFTG